MSCLIHHAKNVRFINPIKRSDGVGKGFAERICGCYIYTRTIRRCKGERENSSRRNKAAGLTAGVPDICLPVPKGTYSGLYIEMKYNKNKPTPEQQEFMQMLSEYGYKTAVCYSFEDAREVIRHYLARASGFDLVNCEEAFKQWNVCEGVTVDVMPNSPCKECPFYKSNQKE